MSTVFVSPNGEGYRNPLLVKTHLLHLSYVRAFDLKNAGLVGRALRGFNKLLACFEPEEAAYVEVLRQKAVCLRRMGRNRAANRAFHEAYHKARKIHHDLAVAVLLDWSAVLLDRKQEQEAIEMLKGVGELSAEHPKRLQLTGYLGRAYLRTDDQGLQAEGLRLIWEVCGQLDAEGSKALLLDMSIYPLELLVWPDEFDPRDRRAQYEDALELAEGSPVRTLQVRVCHKTGHRWLATMNVVQGVIARLTSILPA